MTRGEAAAAPLDAGRRARLGWALYDWAAQPYFTVVLTFIFGPYFQNVVMGDPAVGQAYWGYGQSVAGVLVALTGPILGAVADARGRRKPWVALSILMMVIGLSVTWIAMPGATGLAFLILAGMALASLGAEYGVIFTNAMLPDLAKPGQMGRLSGFGWGMGYLGGLVMLLGVLYFLALPETPLFGLDKAAHEPDRIVGPLAAVWLVIFSLPLFMHVRERPRRALAPGPAVRRALADLIGLFKKLGAHRNIAVFLAARMAYYDGVTAVYVFGGLYAAGTFGWSIVELGAFGIALISAGAIGVFAGGAFDDKLGSKRTIMISAWGISLSVVGILSITPDSILFGIPVEAAPPGAGDLFGSPAEKLMLGFGVVVGIFLGPVQAASRTLMARISPPEAMTAFFGLYALTGRATAWVAPLLVAIVTQASGSRRLGISTILILLVAGIGVLSLVKEPRTGRA